MGGGRKKVAEQAMLGRVLGPAIPEHAAVAAGHADDEVGPREIGECDAMRGVVGEVHAELARHPNRIRFGGVSVTRLEAGRSDVQVGTHRGQQAFCKRASTDISKADDQHVPDRAFGQRGLTTDPASELPAEVSSRVGGAQDLDQGT